MKTRILVALAVLSLAGAALAQTVCAGGTVVVATTKLTHGSWRSLPDGGFSWSACGTGATSDGGVATLPHPCIDNCEAGPFNSAPAVCTAKWKAANGL